MILRLILIIKYKKYINYSKGLNLNSINYLVSANK